MINPSCELGYTHGDIEVIFGSRLPAFLKWMSGQTIGYCEGKRYNYEIKEYEPTNCSSHPHGFAYYVSDVHNFLAKGSITD